MRKEEKADASALINIYYYDIGKAKLIMFFFTSEYALLKFCDKRKDAGKRMLGGLIKN